MEHLRMAHWLWSGSGVVHASSGLIVAVWLCDSSTNVPASRRNTRPDDLHQLAISVMRCGLLERGEGVDGWTWKHASNACLASSILQMTSVDCEDETRGLDRAVAG